MAFETSVLQNGEWTTRTLDVDTVLRHYDQQDKQPAADAVEIEKAPVMGLLTQTVVKSPLVHWILPAKLRDPEHNDVAFIGDRFVQIKEVRPDGHLWDVVRKEILGARIRNARVIGSTEAFLHDRERRSQSTPIKDEDDQDAMDVDAGTNGHASGTDIFPPQAILIQLDTGESVFMILRRSGNGALEFVSSRHRVSKAMLKLQPGTHLAVDPSSRYMAIACSESIFAIYALQSRAELQGQYSQGQGQEQSLRYVGAERHIYVQGVILKMEFLYPSPADEGYVILLVLTVRKGKTRMLIYDGEPGYDLKRIRVHSHRGHLLEEARRMPLLIIPLRIKSAFILVSETTMSICRNIMLGQPTFLDISDQIEPPTRHFVGSGCPLWTSWARPTRRADYSAIHDDIYIVREDGLLKYIETDCGEEDLVKTDMNIGQLSCHCGPAFACLEYIKPNEIDADILVTSGDSCAGGAYLIEAREAPKFMEFVQNWSPTYDFVTDREDHFYKGPSGEDIHRPDRIFTCGGKGVKGTITELRYGLEANIGLEIPYDAQIMDIWPLSSDSGEMDNNNGCLFLLSLGDRSSVLYLSSDATEIFELEPDASHFDLSSRTIAASQHGQTQVQVTERSIVFIIGPDVLTLSKNELLEVYENKTFIGLGEKVDLAIIYHNVVLFTILVGETSYLKIVESLPSNPAVPHAPVTIAARLFGQYSSSATCLSMGLIAKELCVVTAEYDSGSVRLVFQPLLGGEPRMLVIPSPQQWDGPITLEAFASIVLVPGSPGTFIVVCGTCNGIIVTLEVNEDSLNVKRSWFDRIGLTEVILSRNEYAWGRDIVFVNCDLKTYALTPPAIVSESSNRIYLERFGRTISESSGQALSVLSGRQHRIERKISRIFFTDALNPIIQQPLINSIARLQPNLSGGTDGGLLIVSGSQIVLAGFSAQSKPVPRHLPIPGSPWRLLYSRNLECLIVAASVDGRSTLLFIDPETGEDLSCAIDKNGNAVDFISGLGNLNERVFRLIEWTYLKRGKTWVFIIVSTNTGRLIIVSTQKGESTQAKSSKVISDEAPRNKIRYWTLHKVRYERPVYSVAGFDEGLFYCSGNILYCEILDMTEKKFRRVAQYVLPSPAINLTWKDRQIYALTTAHSLEILRLEGEATLDAASADDTGHKIIRTHGDQVTRNTLHHHRLTDGLHIDNSGPIDIVSDKSCTVVGLWATHGTRADTLETVFEAQLPCSILRFRASSTRPVWDSAVALKPDVGIYRLASMHPGYEECLGLSIDGSLFSFTPLAPDSWRFLKFIVNLAQKSSKVCEFTHTPDGLSLEPAQEPKAEMHVDGDILRRCVDDGNLDVLLGIGLETEEAVALQERFVKLHRGMGDFYNDELDPDDVYDSIEQAYKDLEFFLRPVL